MARLIPRLATILYVMTSLSSMTSLATQHVGQVRIFVDQSGVNHFKKMTGKSGNQELRQELDSTIFEINQIFKTLETYGVNLQLQIDDVVTLDRDLFDTKDGKTIHLNAMKYFEEWVKPTYATNKYDLAILFTGVNLVRENWKDTTYGYGYIGSVCSPTGLAVIEFHSTYYDVLAAAHELGHIFGANHDGEKGATQCPSDSGYIMNAFTLPASRNHFAFSSCSGSFIKNNIDRLNSINSNCMLDSGRVITGPRYGSMMTPDGMCKRKFGPGSYVARKAYGSYGDDVCSQLACMTKTVKTFFYWNFIPTPQGMNCGQNKQCVQGRCVTTSGGSPKVSDKCPFGDQPKIEGEYQMTCAQITPELCQYWNNTCCETCAPDPGTPDEICKRLEGRDSAMARRAYTTYGHRLCSKLACLTSVTGTYFRWNYHQAPNGMKCGKNKRCSKGECLASSHGDPNMSDNCPYGDQPYLAGDWQSTCRVQVQRNGCNGWNEACCGSCPS